MEVLEADEECESTVLVVMGLPATVVFVVAGAGLTGDEMEPTFVVVVLDSVCMVASPSTSVVHADFTGTWRVAIVGKEWTVGLVGDGKENNQITTRGEFSNSTHQQSFDRGRGSKSSGLRSIFKLNAI